MGVLRQNAIWMLVSWPSIEYTKRGEGGGFPQVRAVVNLMSPNLPVICFSTKSAQLCIN
jgi:hypothetical protein